MSGRGGDGAGRCGCDYEVDLPSPTNKKRESFSFCFMSHRHRHSEGVCRSHFPTIPTQPQPQHPHPPRTAPRRLVHPIALPDNSHSHSHTATATATAREFCPIARWSFARSPEGVCPIARWSLPDRPMEFCPIAPITPARFIRSHNRSAADRTYGLTNINRVVCRFKKYDLNSTNPRLLLGNREVAIRK